MNVRSASAWEVALPMKHDLILGPAPVRNREYVILRLVDCTGTAAWAVGYSRGTPLLETLRLLCASLVDCDRMAPPAVQTLLKRRFANAWESVCRAASLIDLALWQLAWRRTDESPHCESVMRPELMGVAGYFPESRSPEVIAAEGSRMVSDGFGIIKLMLGNDREGDLVNLRALRAAIGSDVRLGIDAHGSFANVPDALNFWREAAPSRVEFLEDPFWGRPLSQLAELRSASVTVAVGEDLTDLAYIDQLLDCTDYLRVDATVSGGYTALQPILEMATQRGKPVIPHVFPAFHRRLAGIQALEAIPEYVGAEPIYSLLADPASWLEGPVDFDESAVRAAADIEWEIDYVKEIHER